VFLNCAALKVKYDIPRLLRSPLDLHNFILGDDSLYDLGEDGFYYTNVDLQFGDETVRAGYKLTPQNNGVTFVYNGKEEDRIKPSIKSVSVTQIAGSSAPNVGALVEIIAEGIQAGNKVQIKAVHKTTGHTVTGEGIVALGKAENRGYFVALKTLTLDVGVLEDYNISASLDGKTWVDGSGKPVQLDYIRVTSSPKKASYTVGDKLDLTGLVIKASYTDKSSKTLDGSTYTTTPSEGSELNTVGKQTVIVKYKENGIEKTASFDVTVNDKDNGGGKGSGGGSKGGGGSKTPETDNNTTTGGAVTIPVTNPTTTNSHHFEDMPSAPWAAEAVNFVTSRGLFTGTSTNHFEPDGTMTRAMVMTVLFRIEGGDASANAPSWYSDALNWSKEKGLSDGSNPNGYITREQLAAILYRHAGSPATAGSLNSFSDRDQVSAWAADALSWAVEKGLITGKGNGVLDPGGNATRAEVAAIIMRYLSK
ncbi:MAG TPA: S-layer homology domain-containing protein, partial [Bacillota bacterium]|nr:S-layer homology domain-containing protein [Bacillota bacterium]